jgi:hypothetical protein
MRDDELPPVLGTDAQMARKVDQSTVSLKGLVEGRVSRAKIECGFSPDGCGAVLVKLDERHSALYDRYYRLQWQLGSRTFKSEHDREAAAAALAALDFPVQQLLRRCGVAVARIRKGLGKNTMRSSVDSERLRRNSGAPLTSAIGRPLAANRQEFHPSVDRLFEHEQAGSLGREKNPSYEIVARSTQHPGSVTMGRSQADEVRLLELYREWESASADERQSHGNKYNGDIYYGAFRGCTHLDAGGTMTVLLGPGELRDRRGIPVPNTTKSHTLGGTLMLASPGEEIFTSLPYRLPCGSPYVVVFFERYHEVQATSQMSAGAEPGINTNALGWAGTVHGVRRIENTAFSRGQVVVHVRVTENDLK